MQSDTVNGLVETLTDLESRLKELNEEARRLGELRGDLKGMTTGLQSAGKDLQSVAAALRDGAATMRELDMAATLKRLTEIETALDIRSMQLEATIDRQIAALNESIQHQVLEHFEALPALIGPAVVPAFAKQFEATNSAINSLVANASSSHAEHLAILQQNFGQQADESRASAAAIGQAIDRLSMTALEASKRQMNAILKSLAEADARASMQWNATQAMVQTATQRTARLLLVCTLFAAAAFAVAVVGVIIVSGRSSP